MKITDIRIRKVFDNGPMKAVVSVTFDDQFAVHDIKVIDAGGKNFIVMPSRKNADGSYRDVAHPINAQFRSELEQAVMSLYVAQSTEMARDAARQNGEPVDEQPE